MTKYFIFGYEISQSEAFEIMANNDRIICNDDVEAFNELVNVEIVHY